MVRRNGQVLTTRLLTPLSRAKCLDCAQTQLNSRFRKDVLKKLASRWLFRFTGYADDFVPPGPIPTTKKLIATPTSRPASVPRPPPATLDSTSLSLYSEGIVARS